MNLLQLRIYTPKHQLKRGMYIAIKSENKMQMKATLKPIIDYKMATRLLPMGRTLQNDHAVKTILLTMLKNRYIRVSQTFNEDVSAIGF
mmetsp:Transcript_18786/g.46638  ORF Transcript_18786/g.46638 Transcript_18786/m.46638 type:complete len:89 (-) Transcript_18786:64-330(-)